MKKRKPSTVAQKAYSRGYEAGRKIERRGQDDVITALRSQIEFWRVRCEELKALQQDKVVFSKGICTQCGIDAIEYLELKEREEAEFLSPPCPPEPEPHP